MTLKIETHRHGNVTMLRLVGRIRAEHVGELERLIARESSPEIALDLQDVTLVDSEVISLLAAWVKRGVPLLNCAAYITEWIAQERQRHS